MISPDTQLEQVLKVLVERFGPSRTLGQVYATTYGLRRIREGNPVSLNDIAEVTGVSKQNLSRWSRTLVSRERISVAPHEIDGRMQLIDVTNPGSAGRHLSEIAEILGCLLDPPNPRN
ncbi:MAG: MarR family transcriptional regulator [Pseudomonadales bacterium]|jgi:DNA-binding MarR family transcriptional regulator